LSPVKAAYLYGYLFIYAEIDPVLPYAFKLGLSSHEAAELMRVIQPLTQTQAQPPARPGMGIPQQAPRRGQPQQAPAKKVPVETVAVAAQKGMCFTPTVPIATGTLVSVSSLKVTMCIQQVGI
ncbi:hypothetical protein KIPB_013765, partial [Kipferlia bialata]